MLALDRELNCSTSFEQCLQAADNCRPSHSHSAACILSHWDWPERGCGKAQPQHVRTLGHTAMISKSRRLRTRCDWSCGDSRAPPRPRGSESTTGPAETVALHLGPEEARALHYVEFRNARLRLPAFCGLRRARDL